MSTLASRLASTAKRAEALAQHSREFDALVRAIGECRSKAEEDAIVAAEVATLKPRLIGSSSSSSGGGNASNVFFFVFRRGAPLGPRAERVPRQARVHRHARARRVVGIRQGAAGVQRHEPDDEEGALKEREKKVD